MLSATKDVQGFIGAIVLAICVTSVRCYSIPEPRFELLTPKGFRVSIPDTSEKPGIALFAFHGAVDRRLQGVQPGDFSGEVLSPTGGRWVYENRKVSLEPGQRIYYWIHVQHGLRGYRLLDKSYKIGEEQTHQQPDTSSNDPFTSERGDSNPPVDCDWSKTTVRGRRVCQGELIFEDDFDVLNNTIWKREIRIPLDVDDADFVVYQDDNENAYIVNGKLHIVPTRLDQVPGYSEAKLRNGDLDLGTKCTGIVDVERECKRRAGLFRILPPVVSARINTKQSFSFRYGKIEVRAKLPRGDWLFPLIVLDPLTSDYGISGYASGQMRVAFIRANEHLETKEGRAIDGTYLSGGVVLKAGSEDRDKWLKTVRGSEHWGNAFHTYTLTWTDTRISIAYDGNTYATIGGGGFNHISGSRTAPFDKEFYISLGLSAGGISDFPDGCVSNTNNKPWQNTHPKAELHFWNARNKWFPTWNAGDSSLVIDYVKVWAL